MKTIEKNQIKKIHILKSVLKLNDDVYRALLSGQYHVDTSKDLNFYQAQEFIHLLEVKAVSAGVWHSKFDMRQKYNELGHRPGYASPAQLRMIESMWKDVSYLNDAESRKRALNKLVLKIVNADCLENILFEDVRKIVNTLKYMKCSKKKIKGGVT